MLTTASITVSATSAIFSGPRACSRRSPASAARQPQAQTAAAAGASDGSGRSERGHDRQYLLKGSDFGGQCPRRARGASICAGHIGETEALDRQHGRVDGGKIGRAEIAIRLSRRTSQITTRPITAETMPTPATPSPASPVTFAMACLRPAGKRGEQQALEREHQAESDQEVGEHHDPIARTPVMLPRLSRRSGARVASCAAAAAAPAPRCRRGLPVGSTK